MSDSGFDFGALQSLWQVMQSSALFGFAVLFLKVYSLVIVIDMVLLIFLRDVSGDLTQTLHGDTNQPLISKSKLALEWKKIVARFQADTPSQYKAAILEADELMNRILDDIGYHGANMGEKLAAITEGKLTSLAALKSAHLIRNKIIKETDFELSKDEAKAVLQQYRTLLEELEILT